MVPVELWGGPECTVNRVGENYFDQTVLTGHQDRPQDLDDFAALGLKALRYPVLWERVAPHAPDRLDWRWSDERLGALRDLGIRPIVGLVHHGSGPRYTSLIDPGFAPGLAAFAVRVAERYPWVDAYTPVNEPLTTARFSGLYGHWYPHGRDNPTFLRILLNEIGATHRAMRAIRAVVPHARLIQTDDLGRTFSTPRLVDQADFENERRWLTFDLLAGRVDRHHPLWSFLIHNGVGERKLKALCDDPCPPDIIGVNHYLTSERFLDERLERYPPQTHGGNGRDRYADVEAVRVVAEGPAGPERLLLEAWERYGIPLAVTEVHNGCTHDEQLRWFQEVWDAAERLSRRGVDIRAVTAWALLGSCDWNCLVTRCAGHYEPGVFDIRGQRPRATAIGRLMRDLAQQGTADHPVLDVPGWWCRPDRLAYPPVSCGLAPASPPRAAKAPRPLLITGANGTLGRAFARLCDQRGLPFHLLTRVQFDIADPRSVADGLARYRPWAVINAAGFVRVDEAERMPAPCRRDNSRGPAVLAHACGRAEVALLSFSSDLVFDGAKREPYLERDTVAPLSIYGLTKAEAEAAILEAMPHALIVRTSAFFGPWDEHNFIAQALQALEARRSLRAAADVTVSPTYVPDLVHACLDLLIDGESGLWHLASMGAVSWADLAREAATRAGLNAKLVEAVPSSALGWTARRPVYSVLGSGRGALMPGLDDALGRYFAAR